MKQKRLQYDTNQLKMKRKPVETVQMCAEVEVKRIRMGSKSCHSVKNS